MKISFEPIFPKKDLLNPQRYIDGVVKATAESKNGVQADFKKTTNTWEHKPRWYTTRRGYDWFIGTKDEIYGYVDLGTKAHTIRAKTKKGLAFFATGFKPKSRVNYIASYKGKKANKNFRRPMSVQHPGTQARNFSEKIRNKWEKEFQKKCRAAIKAAAK